MFGSIVSGVVSFCGACCRVVRSASYYAAAAVMFCLGLVQAVGVRAAVFAVVALMGASGAFAQSGPTLPDLGIDPADYIPLASAAVAAIALVAIGYKIGWKVLFRGLGWIGRALSPR